MGGLVGDCDWMNLNLSRVTHEEKFVEFGLKPMGSAGERLCRCGELLHGYQGDFCRRCLVLQRDVGRLDNDETWGAYPPDVQGDCSLRLRAHVSVSCCPRDESHRLNFQIVASWGQLDDGLSGCVGGGIEALA